MLLNGRFEATIPGRYVVSAEANGFRAESTLTVAANDGYPYMRLLRKAASERTESEQRQIDEWIARGVLTVRPVSSRDIVATTAKGKRSSPTKVVTQSMESPSNADPSGWDNSNYTAADDPINWVGRVIGAPSQKGAANGNYNLSLPAVNLEGRGALGINLNLEYNSRLWSKAASEVTYNADAGYPAPGWNLGFGKMFHMGSTGGCMLVAPDDDSLRRGIKADIGDS